MDDPWRILSAFGSDGTMAGLSCITKAAGILAGAGLVALALIAQGRGDAAPGVVSRAGRSAGRATDGIRTAAMGSTGATAAGGGQAGSGVEPSAGSSTRPQAGCHRNADRAGRVAALVAIAAGVTK